MPLFEGEINGLGVCCVSDDLAPGVHCMAYGSLNDAQGRPVWHTYATEPRLPDAEPATVKAWLDGCMAPSVGWQRAVAARMGVSEHAVSDWLNAKTFPAIPHLQAASRVSRRSLDWLITGRDFGP